MRDMCIFKATRSLQSRFLSVLMKPQIAIRLYIIVWSGCPRCMMHMEAKEAHEVYRRYVPSTREG